MDLRQILVILRARYSLVLLVLAGTVAVTFVACLVLPKRYTAAASVVVDVKSADPIAGALISVGVLPNLNLSLHTEADVITSQRVARRVVKMLKLDTDEAFKQLWMEDTDGQGSLEAWVADRLLKKLTVKPASLQSNVLPIKFVASDPEFAAAVANAFAQAYIDVTVELKVEPAKQYAAWFARQEQTLRENLERAQAKLSKFQQTKRIVAKDEQFDNETTKLNELSAQLTLAQTQTTDARSRQRSGQAADSLPEVAQNPLITALKTDLARHEAKLQEVAGNLGRNHPQYQRMESEVASLREKLRMETRHITSGFSASQSVGKNKEAEMIAAIEAQKNKLLRMKNERDQLFALQREVDAARKAHDAITHRLQQSTLDSQVTQTNVSVLSTAVAPSEPSFPKLFLYTLLAIPAGLLLGVAAAYAFELHDRYIRSSEDLAELLQAPLLGVIERPTMRGRRLLPWPRQPAPAVK